MIPETQKKYVITTENAVDPHGLTVLHVSELINNDEDLAKIATDEEWSTIKTIMRAIISGNVGSYQYLPLMEKARGKGGRVNERHCKRASLYGKLRADQ